MKSTAILTPLDLAEAVQVGRRSYRKQVLPVGQITYNGQTIKFDKPFLEDLVSSFQGKAYDQVPFVLADTDNRHNMDPERFRGEVAGFDLADDGLYMTVNVNKRGARVLEDNPNLGVSARIVEGLAKADGRTFKRAIQHVLGTMAPRVSGLGPWQAVDLSEDDEVIVVVDLTAVSYEEDDYMAKAKTATTTATSDTLDLSDLSDAEFLQFLDLADSDDVGVGTSIEDPVADEEAALDAETGDDEDDIIASLADEDAADDEGDEDEDADSTDLSDVADFEVRTEVQQLRRDLAEQRFQSERREYMRAGVPRSLLDLAEPLLSSPEVVVIDLSDGGYVNATEIVRGLLDETKGYVDVRPEVGHQTDLAEDGQSESDSLLEAWDQEYGSA